MRRYAKIAVIYRGLMSIRRFAAPILLVVFLCLMAWSYLSSKTEAFGYSPGTIIQLRTSHVPTEEEVEGGGNIIVNRSNAMTY